MKLKLTIFLLFLFLCQLGRSQAVSKIYSQVYLRDIVTSDSSLFCIHYIPSDDVNDLLNTKGKVGLYKFDFNLVLKDSLILDSISVISCFEESGILYLAGKQNYPDTFTCSMHFFKMDHQLNVLNHREFKTMNVTFSPMDLSISNDSLRIFVFEDRFQGMGVSNLKEFMIDTGFNNLDSVSCTLINTHNLQYYYNNSVSNGNRRVHSGFIELNNRQPIYFDYLSETSCSEITPFADWDTYVQSNSSFTLVGGFSNFLLREKNSSYIAFGGEENFGTFNSVTGVLKTDSVFNIQNFYFHTPDLSEENTVPFRNRNLICVNDQILLASNTKMEAFLSAAPYEDNALRIDLLDTNLNYISGRILDPTPSINRPYYGTIIQLLADGGVVVGGNFMPVTISDPPLTFLFKYSGFSELLSILEEEKVKKNLLVYPNPTNDILKINRLDSFEDSQVKFYDVAGKWVRTMPYDENGFSVTDFSPGIYFIEVITEQGVFSGKFVKD